MSLQIANDFAITRAGGASPPAVGAGAMRLLAMARRLRLRAALRPMIRLGRLSAADLRDAGVRSDEIRQRPIWGHGGIMWRP
ncbi:hypothetical protein [Falsiroseomonas sp. HW251]|uniref:hypothetical protein n=1 Tax=Falsiroseomonas sp. HW251 TaxID=3390998 RepID=UPI003D310611